MQFQQHNQVDRYGQYEGPSQSGQQQQQQQPQQQQQQQEGQQLQNRPAENSMPPAPSHDPHTVKLTQAGLVIDDRLKRDERCANATNLDNMLANSGGSTSSDYAVAPSVNWQPFTLKRSIPLPDALWEQFDLTNARCSMGFFPEIERVWFTVDHRLILWDYTEGSAFMTYDQLDDVIMSVGIAPPKPGYFVDEIKHVLVLATRLKIVLLGIANVAQPGAQTSQPNPTTIGFYLTGLEASTNGIVMDNIATTKLGRIFAAGGDGHLHEVDYQVSSGWFRSASTCTLKNCTGSNWTGSIAPWMKSGTSDPIVQIVADSSRHYLYTRRGSGTLELFSLGTDGLQVPTARAKLVDLCSAAALLLPNSPLLDPRSFTLVTIFALSASDSRRFGLVGITSTGVRLFFMIRQDGGMSDYYNGPLCLRLAHVRIPPMNQAPAQRANNEFYAPQQQRIGIQIPQNHVHMATCASGGLYIASHISNEGGANEADTLALVAPDVGRLSQAAIGQQVAPFREAAGALSIDGTARAIHEVGANLPAGSNEIASQTTAAVRAFVVVTTRSLSILLRHRPIDILSALLERAGENNQELLAFFDGYGRDQTCAMCLALISGATVQSTMAARQVTQSLPSIAAKETSAEVISWAKRVLYELAGRPLDPSRGFVNAGVGAPGPNAAVSVDGKVVYSGRHEALALNFARLVRSIWRAKITGKRPAPQQPDRQESTFTAAYLSAVHHDLEALKNTVDSTVDLSGSTPDSLNNPADGEAMHSEHASIGNLQALLKRSVEALSFVILLIDHQLPTVLAACPKEVQDQLSNLTYQELLTSQQGREIARRIVSAIINQQISRGQSVDAVSTILQQRCGSFCSSDDVYLHKAADNMRRARDNPHERQSCLREAIRLYSTAAKQLSQSKLREICGELQSLRYSTGAVDLSILCASQCDDQSLGLSWWTDGCPENDSRQPAFAARNEYYSLTLEILEKTEKNVADALSKTPIAQTAVSDAEGERDNAFERALAAPDKPLHFRLYDWLLGLNKTDVLLNIQSPFIQDYLLSNKTDIQRYDLLWQFYVRNRNYYDAAFVLSELADSSEFGLDLGKRLEYLSLASSHARSQLPTADTQHNIQELLKDADDKLEVAQIQVEVLRDVIGSTEPDDDEKENLKSQLNARLYTATELFTQFAQPCRFFKTMLLIFYVSDYRDSSLVLDVWSDLLEKIRITNPVESRLDAIAAAVVELGRRFYPADIVFPLYDLIDQLEQESLDYQSNSQTGWAIKTLHEAGVPYDSLFDPFDELFSTKSAPWHTNSATSFLAAEGILLLEIWFGEAMAQRLGPVTSRVPFPAADVMSAGDRYAGALASTHPSKQRWANLARKIRSEF